MLTSNITNHFHGFTGEPHQLKPSVSTRLGEVLDAELGALKQAKLDSVRTATRRILGATDEARRLLTLEGDNEYWKSLVTELCNGHEVTKLFRTHDDFSRLAWEAVQQGEPGNSRVIDQIYFRDRLFNEIDDGDELARGMFYSTTRFTAASDCQRRREIIADFADEFLIGDNAPENPRVLSVAAGRSREVELSKALRTLERLTFTPLDVDNESLEISRTDYESTMAGSFAPIESGIKGIATGTTLAEENGYDLIYSLGLYDYLGIGSNIAKRLTAKLEEKLNPGGKLVIANYRDSDSRGFLEGIMDWWLVYRNNFDDLLTDLPTYPASETPILESELGNIIYLELNKPA